MSQRRPGGAVKGHPLFARGYLRASPRMDEAGLARRRRALLDGLAGRVIDVGAGNGLNFRYLPATVTAVVAVEPEPLLRKAARHNARQAPVPVTVVGGFAAELPVPSSTFDAAVVSLVLCSVPDQEAALAELFRVVRPGGQLRFLEHVRADRWPLRLSQRLADATLWPLITGGCHTSRDTLAAVERAGFELDRLHRFRFPDLRASIPSTPHVLGVATRP